MSKHDNTWDTRPENRYQNDMQKYGFSSLTEVTAIRDRSTNWRVKIPSLGIVAGQLRVDGIIVVPEGSLSVPQAHVVWHDPDYGDTGRINIETDQ